MKLKISATLTINEEHKEAFKANMPTRESVNKELDAMLQEMLKDNPVVDSGKITGWIEE